MLSDARGFLKQHIVQWVRSIVQCNSVGKRPEYYEHDLDIVIKNNFEIEINETKINKKVKKLQKYQKNANQPAFCLQLNF